MRTKTMQRKRAWLALAGLSPLLSLGCTLAPTLTRIAPIQPTASLQGVQVALVEFVPLPKTYPVDAKALWISAELYDEQRAVQRPGTATTAREATTKVQETLPNRTFVPRDHLNILTKTMLLAMKQRGMPVQLSPSMAAAQKQGADVIVAGVVKEFKVTLQESPLAWLGPGYSGPTGEADIRVWTVILSGQTGARLWEGELQSRVTHSGISTNALDTRWIQILSINESSFHPLRALLAVASYNLAAQLVDRLAETATLAGRIGP